MTTPATSPGTRPGLLDDLVPAAPPARAGWLRIRPAIPAGWRAAWAARMADPLRRRKTVALLRAAGVAAVLGLGVGAYLVFRPVPQPDYLADDIDSVFDYTLLTDEFNKLPVEERLALMGQLVQRMKSMSAGDSVLLSAFAAGIAGSARRQIEENVSRLAVDVWDKYAKDYGAVPDAERAAYLEKTFVEFTKMMEAVGGSPRDVPDEERLAEAKRQSDRDRQNLRSGEAGMNGEAFGTAFTFMNTTVGGHASPQQRVRGGQMMRDMARQFRGQDLATGKPLPPPK